MKFLNISNHPSIKWSEKQLSAARSFGDILDIPFPKIDPEATTEEIKLLAQKYFKHIKTYGSVVVMLQGEFTFTYSLVKLLRKENIIVLSACASRISEETVLENGKVIKNSFFEFVSFREYE